MNFRMSLSSPIEFSLRTEMIWGGGCGTRRGEGYFHWGTSLSCSFNWSAYHRSCCCHKLQIQNVRKYKWDILSNSLLLMWKKAVVFLNKHGCAPHWRFCFSHCPIDVSVPILPMRQAGHFTILTLVWFGARLLAQFQVGNQVGKVSIYYNGNNIATPRLNLIRLYLIFIPFQIVYDLVFTFLEGVSNF